MIELSRDAEDLLTAMVERVRSLGAAALGNVFRLERRESTGGAVLDQPHIDMGADEPAWRLQVSSHLVDELCQGRLLETAPSGARPEPDRWVIRAGIPAAALRWYEERMGKPS